MYLFVQSFTDKYVMKQLYFPIEVPNLETVQQQLLKCIPESYLTTDPKAFTCDVDVLNEHCPELIKWLVDNSKVDILHYRFYITPPKSRLLPHIDGEAQYRRYRSD